MQRTLDTLGRPQIGSLIEWVFILLWIGAWFVIGFVLTDIGQEFSRLDIVDNNWAAAGIALWICLWIIFIICRASWHSCYEHEERLAKSRLVHMIYHTVRWPILFGALATEDVTVIVVALLLDALVVVLAFIIFVIVWLVRCSSSGGR